MFVNFLTFFLLLISSFILLWLEKIISIFLNFLRHVLGPDAWFLSEDILCVLENTENSTAVGGNALHVPASFVWCVMWLQSRFLIASLSACPVRAERGCEGPQLLMCCCSFLLSVLLVFASQVWCSRECLCYVQKVYII